MDALSGVVVVGLADVEGVIVILDVSCLPGHFQQLLVCGIDNGVADQQVFRGRGAAHAGSPLERPDVIERTSLLVLFPDSRLKKLRIGLLERIRLHIGHFELSLPEVLVALIINLIGIVLGRQRKKSRQQKYKKCR